MFEKKLELIGANRARGTANFGPPIAGFRGRPVPLIINNTSVELWRIKEGMVVTT